MKILFLDIDGVLNYHKFLTQQTISDRPYGDIDESRVILLKEIVAQTGAKIVLSSSWKTLFDEQLTPTTPLSEKLINALSEYDLSLYDKTETLNEPKGNEVRKWLSGRDDIDAFVILDDDTASNWFELSSNWIRTSYYVGLTKEHVQLAIQILNCTPEATEQKI